MEKTWTVYMHTNKINNKVYIGITSQKVQNRWNNGKGYFVKNKEGKFSQQKFARAIQKYGWDNFEHIIFAEGLSKDEACHMERLLIAIWHAMEHGYNSTIGGEGSCGYVPSEELRQLLRQKRGYTVCQFDMDMNFIAEYQSVREAAEKTGLSSATILQCCDMKDSRKVAGEYVWIFKSDLPNIDFDEYRKSVLHDVMPNAVYQYTLSMEFVCKYKNISEASKLTGIQFSDISRALVGKAKQAGGYIWVNKNDFDNLSFEELKLKKQYKNLRYRTVYQFTLNMEFIQEFQTLTDAGSSVGVTTAAIFNACKSKSHKSCGFLWWFKDEYEKEAT